MFDERDHRELGRKLNLFHFQEEAPGMAFWHPRGWAMLRALEAAVRALMEADGFEEVRSPQVLRRSIWERSGHWDHFHQNMFVVDGDPQLALKPVSCPGHIQIVQRMALSYRQLPVRLSEFGCVHRFEQSGSLHGLFRARQFVQDDGHVFCLEEAVEGEVSRFAASLLGFYRALGFEHVEVAFADRPPSRAGSDAVWDRAEAVLRAAARSAGIAIVEHPGEGAFYGPKLEFALRDRAGRLWQCGTIQLDLVMPERFDLRYVDHQGQKRHPAMIHRAVLGSLERFIGIVLEEHGAALPAWLAPEQVRLLPVSAKQGGYSEQVLRRLRAAGVRARLEGPDENLSARIRDSHESGVPFSVVLGEREELDRRLSIRARGAQRVVELEEGIRELERACSSALQRSE